MVICYPEQPEEAMGPLLTAAANAHTSLVVPDTADLQQLKCRPLENYVDYGGYRALLQFPGKHQANHAAMAVEIALALWREYHYEIPDEAIETGLRMPKCPHGSRSCAATRCCCWMAATMPMVPQPLLQL